MLLRRIRDFGAPSTPQGGLDRDVVLPDLPYAASPAVADWNPVLLPGDPETDSPATGAKIDSAQADAGLHDGAEDGLSGADEGPEHGADEADGWPEPGSDAADEGPVRDSGAADEGPEQGFDAADEGPERDAEDTHDQAGHDPDEADLRATQDAEAEAHDHEHGEAPHGGLPTPAGAAVVAGGGEETGPLGIAYDSGVRLTDTATGGIGVAYGSTFKLHSLPTSTYKVYLDFDGHTTTGTPWNSYWGTSSFTSPAFSLDGQQSFSTAELAAIQRIWAQVAEAFSPFNIDVTTEDPGTAALAWSGAGDAAHGIRLVVTDEGGKNYGGIALLGSFSSAVASPAFVYANQLGDSVHNIVAAAVHEVGHTLGLNHDGRGSSAYDYGHGSGGTSWAPFMGAGYYASVMQWSNGGYAGATNTEDDLAIITTRNNGVTWRPDEVGNTLGTAGALGGTVAGGIATVDAYGIISGSGARNDIDMYWLSVAACGSVSLTVSPETRAYVTGSAAPVYAAATSGMLNVKLSLYDAVGRLVATADDPARQDAVLSVSNLAGGTYYLAIDGTGWGNPAGASPTGWSEYGSLGQYGITGRYTAGATNPFAPPRLELSKTALTTTEGGGADGVVVRALNATGDMSVSVTGLDATEGRLSASTLVLNAANNWTATLGVTGVDDRDVDKAQGYKLNLSAAGVTTVSVTVTNQDDDVAAASAGTAPARTGATRASATGATVANLSTDNGTGERITEGVANRSAYAEWRWQFTGLTPGDKRVQIDAASSGEAFRFEYSTDNQASWKTFDTAGLSATAWNGSFAAAGVGSSLWVRLVDAAPTGDLARDSFTIDLLTVAPDYHLA